MKRRFPGDHNGPHGSGISSNNGPPRPHDPRLPVRGGIPSLQRAPAQRGPPPGRYQTRGGPPNGLPGRGFPHPSMAGRGPPPFNPAGGRGMGRPPIGRAHAPGRGMSMGRGPMPGRPPMQAGRFAGRPPEFPPNHPPSFPPNHPPSFPPNHPPNIPPNRPPNIPPPPPRPPINHSLPHPGVRPPLVTPQHPPLPSPPVRPGFPNQPPPPLRHHAPILSIQATQPPQLQNPQVLAAGRSPPTDALFHGIHSTHARTIPAVPQNAPGPVVGVPGETILAASRSAVISVQPDSTSASQVDQAWKEYTAPNGIKYYHNSLTKESTYTKPAANLDARSTPEAQPISERPWQEYVDSSTGKKYYSNGVTTTWEKPAAFNSEPEKPTPPEESEPLKKKKKKAEPRRGPEYNNREEAIAAFKGLLLAKGIAPTLKWNEVVKLCSSDPRWEAFEDALTIGERRQALAEYQTKRANELKALERQERIRAKEAFGQLLTEVLPSVQGFSALNSRFADVRGSLSKDDRFYAVQEEETRESLFLDFCEEFRKREERKKRSRKREAHEAFLSFLNEREETGALTFASTWETFLLGLSESEKADLRFAISPVMSDSDRQLYFADFVIDLQAAEDDKRRRIRDARRRAEKAQRDGYRETLRKLASEGKIHPGSRWRSVEEVISKDVSFGPVHTQDRDAPREIFEEFLDEWVQKYQRDRAFLSQLVYQGSRKDSVVKPSTTYQEFTAMLKNEAEYSPGASGDVRRIINREDPVSSARLFYDDLIFRAKEVAASAGNRRSSTALRGQGQLADSSEDEGEIIEEGEVSEDGKSAKALVREEDVVLATCTDSGDATVDNSAVDATDSRASLASVNEHPTDKPGTSPAEVAPLDSAEVTLKMEMP